MDKLLLRVLQAAAAVKQIVHHVQIQQLIVQVARRDIIKVKIAAFHAL